MKEIKMEKLLDLFIEYIEEKNEFWELTGVWYSKEKGEITKFYIEYLDEYDDDEQRKYFAIEKVLSIKFGFIKWLLCNQKIDQEKLDYSLDGCSYIKNDLAWSCIKLTMLLAIQDNPIDYLNSILK